jgi:N-acetylglucosaminyldiphosphoundecaprenol N-acetyl-beta-D-mannosaminyltransferase
MKIDVGGVGIDNLTNGETLLKIDELLRLSKSSYVATPYSELIVFASKFPEYAKVLNNADLSLPDGIGILWAAKYLSLPTKNKLQAQVQLIYTLFSLILNPRYCRTVIKQRVVGSRLIWDIAKLAQEKNYSLALVGGTGGVAEKSAEMLRRRFSKLKVNLALSGSEFSEALVQKISQSNSDILFVAYSPPKQETWIAQNLNRLNVKLVVGLGGTFDYISGKRPQAPQILHYMGLEWLWRLMTQPWRVGRIWNAVPVFIKVIYKYKTRNL